MALGNFKNSPFITGSDFSHFGVTTSILNYEKREWLPAADYPIKPKYV